MSGNLHRGPIQRYQLVCVGDLMLDILVTAPRLRDGMAGGIYVRPGGSAANVAAWAAQAGLRSAWLGSAGEGPAAELLLEDLRRHGVDPLPNLVPGCETSVVISRIGRNANRVMQSARWVANEGVLDEQIEAIAGTEAVHLTGYLLASKTGRQSAEQILSAAQATGSLISFDPSDISVIRDAGVPFIRRLLRRFRVGVIFANAAEARELTGEADAKRAGARLAGWAGVAVVKLGGRGSIVFEPEPRPIPAKRVKALDTTGAGDAYAGAWLANYLSSRDAFSAAVAATEAAGKAIQLIGGRPSAP